MIFYIPEPKILRALYFTIHATIKLNHTEDTPIQYLNSDSKPQVLDLHSCFGYKVAFYHNDMEFLSYVFLLTCAI